MSESNEKYKIKITDVGVIKRETEFGCKVEGIVSKISHIKSKIKSIILEGYLSNIKIVEQNMVGVIYATLCDDTSRIPVIMIAKGNLQFRELASHISEDKKYRVCGTIQETDLSELMNDNFDQFQGVNIDMNHDNNLVMIALNIEIV